MTWQTEAAAIHQNKWLYILDWFGWFNQSVLVMSWYGLWKPRRKLNHAAHTKSTTRMLPNNHANSKLLCIW